MSDHYTLQCTGCGKDFRDLENGFLLQCDEDHAPALLRSNYSSKQLTIQDKNPGIFRYSDWLPVRRINQISTRPVIFQSSALSDKFGLENLFVAFNGYWPEKGAYFETCSFKELEALVVTARIPDTETRTLVVSSASNTGMAFLQICSEEGIPVIVVVPANALPYMWITREKHPNVILAVLNGNVDYYDAIALADIIADQEGFYTEGGAKNIARRDGMGTVILEAAEAIGRIPDHYVQAIGSGTGGIAAWEMSKRLQADGRFGNHLMRLHFVQNTPFTIISDAWQHASPDLLPMDESEARDRVHKVSARVLSNRRPPYSITGGVYHALKDTQGFTYTATNDEVEEYGDLFNEMEGCDLHPAAAVAVAGLHKAVAAGNISRKDIVLLNITGGGINKLEQSGKKVPLKPDIVFNKDDISADTVAFKINEFREAKCFKEAHR